jgi:hypothetical protein
VSIHVNTVGIDLPSDFPNVPYTAIGAQVQAAPRHGDQTFHFGGAWNGIAYRFLSCANADDCFTLLVSPSAATSPEQRFSQDEALFTFFVTGLSVIECFFYGLYWIGSMADTTTFPILAPNRLRDIAADRTMELIENGPHARLFAAAFARLRARTTPGNWQNTPEYSEWKNVRNILAHRASYGRELHATTDTTSPRLDDVWRVLNIPINDQLTLMRRTWLAKTLRDLLDATLAFANATL